MFVIFLLLYFVVIFFYLSFVFCVLLVLSCKNSVFVESYCLSCSLKFTQSSSAEWKHTYDTHKCIKTIISKPYKDCKDKPYKDCKDLGVPQFPLFSLPLHESLRGGRVSARLSERFNTIMAPTRAACRPA